jgi:hypothetical protein
MQHPRRTLLVPALNRGAHRSADILFGLRGDVAWLADFDFTVGAPEQRNLHPSRL